MAHEIQDAATADRGGRLRDGARGARQPSEPVDIRVHGRASANGSRLARPLKVVIDAGNGAPARSSP